MSNTIKMVTEPVSKNITIRKTTWKRLQNHMTYYGSTFDSVQQFLTKEPLWEKIKDWGAFLAAIIPVMISIIQFFVSTSPLG